MSTICPVTGRTHRTDAERTARLAQIDADLVYLRTALDAFGDLARAHPGTLSEHVSYTYLVDAWNAAHDAVDALLNERTEVVINPRPLDAGDAASYALAAANMD